ncbi:MAG TPA: hypothetical protein VFC39_07410 [Acidobacteriaceae bacterium]|nr:hypothetical protein [Acidobacteriaceae bacterium]
MSNESLDEKIVKKKSIPAQIVLWVVIVGLLFLFYKAISGHSAPRQPTPTGLPSR